MGSAPAPSIADKDLPAFELPQYHGGVTGLPRRVSEGHSTGSDARWFALGLDLAVGHEVEGPAHGGRGANELAVNEGPVLGHVDGGKVGGH